MGADYLLPSRNVNMDTESSGADANGTEEEATDRLCAGGQRIANTDVPYSLFGLRQVPLRVS